MIIVPALIGASFGGIMMESAVNVTDQYSTKCNIRYADSNSNFTIQNDITYNDYDAIKSIITVKYPFENVNGRYVRKVVNYATNDRDVDKKVKDIINSRPEYIKNFINVVDKTYTYEVAENIDKQNNNNTEITITYSHITNTYWDKFKKNSYEKFYEYVAVFLGALSAGAYGGVVGTALFAIPFLEKDNILNQKIKILKKRRKRNN